jgi:hypothetical protein
MPNKVKAHELLSKCVWPSLIQPCDMIANNPFDSLFKYLRSKGDLEKQLAELKGELLTLRVNKIANASAAKITRM